MTWVVVGCFWYLSSSLVLLTLPKHTTLASTSHETLSRVSPQMLRPAESISAPNECCSVVLSTPVMLKTSEELVSVSSSSFRRPWKPANLNRLRAGQNEEMIQTVRSTSVILAIVALLLLPLLLLELLLYFLLFLALLLAFLLLRRKTRTATVTGTTGAEAKEAARSSASILRELRRGRFRRSAVAVLEEVMSADLPEDLLLAEELVAEVCQTLEVCDFSSKVLRDLQRSLGESCLYLSGGGMLGMYHLGTVRRLLEEDLMPQHICGTSVQQPSWEQRDEGC
eukprot:s1112_g9.t1